jgi:hypothetical protein
MKKIFLLLLFCALLPGCSSEEYDVCVYGGTSSGVVAAYSAACCGLNVILVEPTNHFGGMTSGGLGFTDIGNKQVVKGIAKQFYRKVGEHYGQLEQWVFEPSVADSIMRSYLDNPRIKLSPGWRVLSAQKKSGRICSIEIEASASPCNCRTVNAKYFIDCSYEGDLMARSGVSYRVGRESNEEYGETLNGVELMTRHQFPDGIDPYRVKGDSLSGLLWGISEARVFPDGTGDDKVQAYNYRICLTDSPENRIPIERAADYDSTRYDLLARLMEACPEMLSLNDWFIWSRMPNGKTDINNRGGFSTDMIGMNHGYPEGSYAERDSIIAAHKSYTVGLLYFFGHDPRVPEQLRSEMLQWGYPKDEFILSQHWTPQLYIRESRRMKGEYVATQADCEGRSVPSDGIAMAAYQMDSHNCQRIVVHKNGKAMVKNEGNVEVGGGLPYPISYRSLTPVRSECTNLLVPVCLSASHIAYGSIRMEPVFMVLGQVSALACAQAIASGGCDVQEVDSRSINMLMDENPYLDGSQPDIIVDDSDSGVTTSSGWKYCERPGGYGLTYLECVPTKGEESVRYSLTIPSDGEYALYAYQPVDGEFAALLDVEVMASGVTYPVPLNRSELKVAGQTSTVWAKVGQFSFSKGEDVTVVISNKGADAAVRSDAIMLIKVQ